MSTPEVQNSLTAEIPARTLYRLLQLRSRVFVIEQDCIYLDLDGRDLEPATRQLWIAEHDEILTTSRLLLDSNSWRIGRVATAIRARSRGLAGELMRATVALGQELASEPNAPSEIVLDGQAHLEGWYGSLGFIRNGETYLEDGIPHVPMRLDS